MQFQMQVIGSFGAPHFHVVMMSDDDSSRGPPRGDGDEEGGTATVIRRRDQLKKPKQYKVILLNDDYTTMEFVVAVLEQIFRKSPAEAMQIMMHVHRRGQGVAGIYSKEIGEAKVTAVHTRAKEEGFPMRCIMEEA